MVTPGTVTRAKCISHSAPSFSSHQHCIAPPHVLSSNTVAGQGGECRCRHPCEVTLQGQEIRDQRHPGPTTKVRRGGDRYPPRLRKQSRSKGGPGTAAPGTYLPAVAFPCPVCYHVFEALLTGAGMAIRRAFGNEGREFLGVPARGKQSFIVFACKPRRTCPCTHASTSHNSRSRSPLAVCRRSDGLAC